MSSDVEFTQVVHAKNKKTVIRHAHFVAGTVDTLQSEWAPAIYTAVLVGSQNESRLSSIDVTADYCQVITGGFESLLGVVVRNKTSVIIKCHITLPTETVEHHD